MITSKYFNIIIIILIIIAVVFTALYVLNPQLLGIEEKTAEAEYAEQLFSEDEVITIDITVDEDEWAQMLEDALQEEYIICDVTIRGTTFYSVGIRPKGNSSLSQVAGSDSDRYSFKIEFDQFVKGQTGWGLDKLAINNIQGDATYMKEYLSYDLLQAMGVETPLYSYANITVNGEAWGLYLAVECVEEAFAQRVFGNDYGQLYLPESVGDMAQMGNMGDMAQMGEGMRQRPDAANAGDAEGQMAGNMPPGAANAATAANEVIGQGQIRQIGDGGAMPAGFGGSGGADLVYTDDKIASYSQIFDNAVFAASDADYNRVIKALKNLNAGTDLGKYINVDQVLRYFAVNTALVNLDSYVSSLKHNYYLYEQDGQLSIIPWDFNLSFAGFQSGSAAAAVNFPIDTPVSGVELSERPLVAKLLEVEEYKEKYDQYLQEIIDGYGNSQAFAAKVDALDSLISEYVKNDATAFYDYEQYKASLPVLKQFVALRSQSIQGQLAGNIPSTTEAQEQNPQALIDSAGLDLSALGQNGGGGGFGDRGGLEANGERPQMPGRIGAGEQAATEKQTTTAANIGANSPSAADNIDDTAAGMDDPAAAGAESAAAMETAPNRPAAADGNIASFLLGSNNNITAEELGTIVICLAAAIAALVFALKFKRRKR